MEVEVFQENKTNLKWAHFRSRLSKRSPSHEESTDIENIYKTLITIHEENYTLEKPENDYRC